MYLSKLSLINFRNYHEATIEPVPMVNCFTGTNGSGKTNLLDAIYYLAMTKSYFSSTDSQNIRHGEGMFILQGEFTKEGVSNSIYASVRQGQKKQFKKNQQEYDRLADHIGQFPVVMVAPTDQTLVTDGGEARRKFLDIAISQIDRNYLDDLIRYHQALSHRNALLKEMQSGRSGSGEMLDVWDERLVHHGINIHRRRHEFVVAFNPHYTGIYSLIADSSESVAIAYESKLNDHAFMDLLQQTRNRDVLQGYTTIGVHKDDLQLQLKSLPVKKFASQGQQKTVVTSLKLAQYAHLVALGFTRPIVLLDDIFDKLDHGRVSRLLEYVTGENFGQVFISDTDPERVHSLFEQKGIQLQVFHVDENTVVSATEAS